MIKPTRLPFKYLPSFKDLIFFGGAKEASMIKSFSRIFYTTHCLPRLESSAALRGIKIHNFTKISPWVTTRQSNISMFILDALILRRFRVHTLAPIPVKNFRW